MLTLDIFRSRDLSGLQKATWMVLLIFVPVIAAIAYLIARGDKMQDRRIDEATVRADASEHPLSTASSPADEISKLAALRDSGALTGTGVPDRQGPTRGEPLTASDPTTRTCCRDTVLSNRVVR